MHTFIKSFGLSVFLFLTVFITQASAATTNLSSDSSYAEGPFTFWCQPYVRSFESNLHYTPETGPCIYSVPNTLTGNKVVAMYRGEVGNSTFVTSDLVSGAQTLLQINSISFAGMTQDEPLFAVIYQSSLNQGTTTFHAYLENGGNTPAGAVENQNYYVLPWKYGPKPVEEFEPVIVIPDILTVWQTDSGQVLDPIFSTYNNLLDTLEASEYIEDQTLFTFLYDWEESNITNAANLKDFIDSVKATCGCERVDLVGHGMGGLIATHYVESGSYGNDVDQLITIGTPFNGVPAAYSAWEAGLVQFDEPIRNGIAQSLLNHQASVDGSSTFSYVQNTPVSSFLELLPASDYLVGASYPSGHPQNTFMESLQAAYQSIDSIFTHQGGKQVRTHQFDSDSGSANTPEAFNVTTSANPPLWPHGEITGTQFNTGDGMVPFFMSAEFFASSDIPLNDITHHNLPSATQGYVFEALSGGAPSNVVNNSYPTSCVLFLTVSQGTDLQITDPNGDKLGKDFDGGSDFVEIARSIYSGPNAAAEYLGVANPVDGTYQVRTQGTASGSFTLTATDVCAGATHSTSTTATTTPGQIVGYNITVDPDDTVTIEPLDNGAPTVTITSPTAGATYLTTDEVFAAATISDPEGSPISQTLYLLNGTPVDHTLPLPFVDELIGTTTLEVSATDIFGNTGSSSIEFFITLPPPEPNEYTIEFLPPIAKDCYLGSKKPYFKLWKYLFDRLRMHIDRHDDYQNATYSSYGNHNDDDYNKKKRHVDCQDMEIFKAGSAVPVKFKVKDGSGAYVQLDGVIPWIVPVKGPKLNMPIEDASYVEQPSTGSYYQWNGSHYQYVWKTPKSAGGYWYYLYIVLPDGSIHSTVLGLR